MLGSIKRKKKGKLMNLNNKNWLRKQLRRGNMKKKLKKNNWNMENKLNIQCLIMK